MTALIMIK
jgi:hypothetical protein